MAAPSSSRGGSDLDEAAAFRPRSRPWIRAVLLNSVLLLGLVGVPYYRGVRRAEESLDAYPAFAACFFGGTVVATPGLAIPAGDREAYATRYVRGPETWPADCADELDAIAIPEATFLLPGPKQAEVEVRAAVELMHAELGTIADHRRAGDAVGDRPLVVLARLQAALSTALLAIGDTHRGAREAISLEGIDRLPAPSRIPLRVADGGSMRIAASPERLRLLTTDGSRASLVEVELAVGRVHELLVRRPRIARGTTFDAEHGYLYFVTSPGTCEADEFGCARRLSGLAMLREGVERPAAEVWLAAHPAGRVDRSLRIHAGHAWILARTEAGGVELREFELPAGTDPDTGTGTGTGTGAGTGLGAGAGAGAGAGIGTDPDPAPPDEATDAPTDVPSLRPTRTRDLEATDALLGEAHAFFLRGAELHAVELAAPMLEEGAPPSPTLRATLASTPSRLWSCGWWVVAASTSAVDVVSARGVVSRIDVRARAPFEGPEARSEPVQLACTDAELALGVVTGDRRASVTRCGLDGCAPATVAAEAIDGLSLSLAGGELWLATWEDEEAVTIRALDGADPGARVAACYERGRGFCGPVQFVPGAGVPLLVARDGTDAAALVWRDARWQPLAGLGAPAVP